VKELSEKLFNIFSSERFLTMQGLANEVPIFIQAYDVSDEDKMRDLVKRLVSRLRSAGTVVAEVNLFNLLIEVLKDDDVLDAIIEEEPDFDRADLFDTIKNHAAPSERLVPRLSERISEQGVKLTFLTGVGHVYPFLRTHTLLDSIQPVMMQHPVVLFFPGEYTQVPGRGSSLRLFGTLQPQGYYRAFNLDEYPI
jgi:hypothetical protein